MSYVLLVDEVERRAWALLHIAAVLAASGGRSEVVDPIDARKNFDAALAAEPAQVDTEQAALMQVLGLGVDDDDAG